MTEKLEGVIRASGAVLEIFTPHRLAHDDLTLEIDRCGPRHRGADEIELTLELEAEISRFEQKAGDRAAWIAGP